MATVTFPIELGGNGLVVSDDTDPVTGLRNGGYLTRFVPALQQTVAVAGFVVGQVSNAAASASAAAGSASAASSSASSAASSAASAATLYDQFDDRYLGPKASNPTVDNDGNALLVGAMYFNTSALETRVWNGTTWQTASVNGGTVNSLIVTGALQYQGTLTGGTGVVNIGSGQIYKDASGNVGVGTTSPIEKIYVVGNIGVNGTGYLTLDRSVIPVGIGTGAPGVQWRMYSNATTYATGAAIQGLSDGAWSASSVPMYLSFRTTPSGSTTPTERLRIDSAGNMGLGVTPSAWDSVFCAQQIGPVAYISSASNLATTVGTNHYFSTSSTANYLTTRFAGRYDIRGDSGSHQWFTAPSGTAGAPITFNQAMTLTNGGNLLVGTATDSGGRLQVAKGAEGECLRVGGDDAGNARALRFTSSTIAASVGALHTINAASAAGTIALATNSIERNRTTSQGYFKASNTGSYGGLAGLADNIGASNHIVQSNNSSATLISLNADLSANTRNYDSYLATGAAGFHYMGRLNAVTVFQVLANGNVQNTNNSYGAISDPKLKDIIGPKSSTWEKTKQYNWVEYYLKSDSDHSFKMLGLNAEEAAAISPGVVDESADLVEVTKVRQVPVQIVRLDENENPVVDEETGEVIYDEVMVDEEYTEWEPNGEFTKSLKYSVVSMQYHRTTQECQQRIESLEASKVQADDLIQQIMARVAALESASA